MRYIISVPQIAQFLNKDPTNPIILATKEIVQGMIQAYPGNRDEFIKQIISDYTIGCMKEDPISKSLEMDSVDEKYVRDTIKMVIKDTIDKFDMIAAIQNDRVIAIAVVNRGECGYYPNIFALQLICSGPRIIPGSIFLAIYLLGLMNAGMHIGLLELAGAYANIDGLCAYDKFGFIESYTIKHEDVCFFGHIDDYDTLPMFVDVAAMTPEIVIDTLVNTPNKPKIARKEPLCNEFRQYIKTTRGITDPNELAIIENLNKFVKDSQDKIAKKRLNKMNTLFVPAGKPKNPIYENKVNLYRNNPYDPRIAIHNGSIRMIQDENLLNTIKEIDSFKKAYIDYEAALRAPPRTSRNANKSKKDAAIDPQQSQYKPVNWINTKKLKSDCQPPLEWIPAKDSETGKGYCRQYI